MTSESIAEPCQSYVQVVVSFREGLTRIWGAEAAYARLACAFTSFHALGQPGLEGPAAEVLQHLQKIRHTSFESMVHVTDVSHLVYATSLFDSFLSDTTVFLFMLIPQAMGKKQQVSLNALIEAPSKMALISELAVGRAREVAYLPVAGRIQFLRDTFGLKIAVDDDTLTAITDLSAIRNEAVHDQSIVRLSLRETGAVHVSSKPLKKLKHEDLHRAIDTYNNVARAIYQSVFNQVLNISDLPAEIRE